MNNDANSGDEGGCRCVSAYPGTNTSGSYDMADILHKYHPNTKVIATNQDLSNEATRQSSST